MGMDSVEIINSLGAHDPLHRMKNRALSRYLPDLAFTAARADSPVPPIAVLLRTDLVANPPHALAAHLRRRHRESLVMMHLPDFLVGHAAALRVFDAFVDIYLVPTPEMRDFVAAFTSRAVEVLIDPIDFLIEQARPNPVRDAGGPLRLMWFGYPESFQKSMTGYLPVLRALVESGEIEFHVVSRHKRYGRHGFMTVHRYDPGMFTSMALQFDACVLSHQPFDFALPTWVKSENKAVLALALGLPVAASRTPAYARLMRTLGLEEFLFSSHRELTAVLRRLSDAGERMRHLQASQARILECYGASRMATDWRAMMLAARARKFDHGRIPLVSETREVRRLSG